MLTYRVVVVALLAAVTYAFTGNAGETTVITVVFNIGGAAIYYIFERLWDAIEWGKHLTMLEPIPARTVRQFQPEMDSNPNRSES